MLCHDCVNCECVFVWSFVVLNVSVFTLRESGFVWIYLVSRVSFVCYVIKRVCVWMLQSASNPLQYSNPPLHYRSKSRASGAL
jgi:hypothetical protein